MRSIILSFSIGAALCFAGFPILTTEFQPKNFMLLMFCIIIGQILYRKDEKES